MRSPSKSEYYFHERVFPRAGTFAVVIAFFGMLSIAYSAAIDTTVGISIFVVGSLGALWILWITSPLILIHGPSGSEILSVGEASIPVSFVGNTRIMDSAEFLAMRRGQTDSAVFLTIRGELPAVLVSINDPNDPHKFWVMSSRKSEELLAEMAARQSPEDWPPKTDP